MHDDGYFDERVAARYDESSAEMFDADVVDPAVDFLAELAGDGRALEFAIGTGRIALPLAQRGVPVHGIDMSEAMVARLRAKPGGEDIGVTIGDFATTTVDGPFSLVYLVFNTIMNLTTQAAQVACFRNAAAHLQPGGCFVIEVGVPGLRLLPPGETFHAFHRDRDPMGVRRVRRREPSDDVASLRDRRREGRTTLRPVPLRVARGVRPDGGARRDAPARALERMEAGAVHERQPHTRVGLGEAGGVGAQQGWCR